MVGEKRGTGRAGRRSARARRTESGRRQTRVIMSLGIPSVEGPVGVLRFVEKELFRREERERAAESHLFAREGNEAGAPGDQQMLGTTESPVQTLQLTPIRITVILFVPRPHRPARRIADVERLLQINLDALVECFDEQIPHARPRLPVLVVTQSSKSVQRDVEGGAEEGNLAKHGFLLLAAAGLITDEDDRVAVICCINAVSETSSDSTAPAREQENSPVLVHLFELARYRSMPPLPIKLVLRKLLARLGYYDRSVELQSERVSSQRSRRVSPCT